jgi:hypothetical protein
MQQNVSLQDTVSEEVFRTSQSEPAMAASGRGSDTLKFQNGLSLAQLCSADSCSMLQHIGHAWPWQNYGYLLQGKPSWIEKALFV